MSNTETIKNGHLTKALIDSIYFKLLKENWGHIDPQWFEHIDFRTLEFQHCEEHGMYHLQFQCLIQGCKFEVLDAVTYEITFANGDTKKIEKDY